MNGCQLEPESEPVGQIRAIPRRADGEHSAAQEMERELARSYGLIRLDGDAKAVRRVALDLKLDILESPRAPLNPGHSKGRCKRVMQDCFPTTTGRSRRCRYRTTALSSVPLARLPLGFAFPALGVPIVMAQGVDE